MSRWAAQVTRYTWITEQTIYTLLVQMRMIVGSKVALSCAMQRYKLDKGRQVRVPCSALCQNYTGDGMHGYSGLTIIGDGTQT